MYPEWINEILICPETKEKLKYFNDTYYRNDGLSYPFNNGILSAVYPKELNGDDARFNRSCNLLTPYYDFNKSIMPLMNLSEVYNYRE
jgi:uncharacterized protein YbaR (Trm112 family)